MQIVVKGRLKCVIYFNQNLIHISAILNKYGLGSPTIMPNYRPYNWQKVRIVIPQKLK